MSNITTAPVRGKPPDGAVHWDRARGSPRGAHLPWGTLIALVLLTVICVMTLSRAVPAHPELAVGVGVGLALLLLAVMRPQWILLALIAMLPMSSFDKLWSLGSDRMLDLFEVLFPLTLGGLLLGQVSGRFVHLSRHPLDRWVFLFIAFQSLLIPIAYDPLTAMVQVRRVLIMALLYYATSRLLADQRWNGRLLRCLAYASAASAAFSLLSYSPGTNTVDVMTERPTGAALADPNTYGLMMIPPLFMAWTLGTESRLAAERLLKPVLIFVLLGGIALTFSRSAFLTLLISFAVMFWLWGRRLHSGQWVGVFVMLALGFALAPAEFWERIGTLFEAVEGGHADYSLWRRFNYLEVALNVYADHPWLGIGPDNFQIAHALPAYQSEPSLIGLPRMAHNVYVQTLCEQGPVGLTLYLMILYSAMRTALAHWRRSESSGRPDWQAGALFLSIIAFVVMGMFYHMLLDKIFWVVLAMVRILPERRP